MPGSGVWSRQHQVGHVPGGNLARGCASISMGLHRVGNGGAH
jgi:hypothetical protein